MGRTSDAKERLISTAIELIRARSYESVGVDALCNHAGVKKGSFYHFFPSKQDLMLAALDQYWEKNTQEKVFQPAFETDVPPLDRIERAFRLAWEAQRDLQAAHGKVPGCAIGNLAAELSTQSPPIREKLENLFSRMGVYFEQALREARDSGEWTGNDPAMVAESLVAYLYGSIMLAKTANDAGVMKQLSGQVRLLVAGNAA